MNSTVKLSDEEHKQKRRAYMRAYNKDYHLKKRPHLQKKYGITLAQRDSLFASQGSVCAICRTDTPPTKHDWFVDHDHVSGAVRGVLCHHCNSTIGYARDNPAILSAAISYLRKFENGGQQEGAKAS